MRLQRFERVFHPGSRIPSRYASYIGVTDAASHTNAAVVAMNQPFRFKGYSFYQQGYTETGGISSVLAVSRRPGRHVPAVATLLVTLGLLVQAARRARMPRGPRRIAPPAGIVLACLFATGMASGSPPDPETLAPFPILTEGRVMPIETFARLQWRQVTGRAAPSGNRAITWLAEAWFDPARSVSNRLFLVQDAAVARQAGLQWTGRRLRASYADLASAQALLQSDAEMARGRPPMARGARDREVLRLTAALSAYELLPLARLDGLVPVGDGDARKWTSLTGALMPTWCVPRGDPGVGSWRSLAEAWRSGDQAAFDAAARNWQTWVQAAAATDVSPARLRWEIRLNRLAPFLWVERICLAALLLAVIATVTGSRHVSGAVWVLACSALALQTAGLALRTVLLGRPPVTNLHATFLFAAWAVLVLGLCMWRRGSLGLLAALPLTGFLLHMAGQAEGGVDTLGPVAAILDTHAWLGLHVGTIMIGFAGCLLAGALAHVRLLAACFAPRGALTASADAALPAMIGVGLSFTLLGTLLGGLWAEIAWGRFWGWDPKENGALAVIVWMGCLWELTRSGRLAAPSIAAGAWLGGMLTMLAWQGVNLLAAGRHSYGWNDGRHWLLAALAADGVLLAATLAATRISVAIRAEGRQRRR